MADIIINNKNYLLSDDLFKKAPIYCKDSRNSRELIKNKKLTDKQYIFARQMENKWIISDGKSRKYDKILFIKELLESIPELNNKGIKINDNNNEMAPEIIILDNHEKFKDENGKIIEIETRGERNVDNIYFKVKDIMIGFNMNSLHKNILDPKTSFIINDDYKYFFCKNVQTLDKKTVKKELFLTYKGILRVLFASHNPNVKPFIKWSTERLFILHLGTTEQKEELVSNVFGVNAKVIKEVFNTSTNTIPCIYLFTLNNVKELRQSMNIDDKYLDDSFVCKYGFTKDLSRRTNEHIETYSKIQNCELKLKFHSYIDPQYISKGESDIKMFMNALNISFNYENQEEIVIIPKNLMNLVQKQYEQIGKNYLGHISEVITKIKELEDKYEKQKLNHQIELQKEKEKNLVLNHQIELQKQQYENDLIKMELNNIKLQLSMKT